MLHLHSLIFRKVYFRFIYVLVLLFGLLGSSVAVFGQTRANGIIQGRVYDASGQEPLSGANISVEGTSKGATSDSLGRYTLREVTRGTYTLKASYVGYRSLIQYEIRVENGVTTQDFALEPVIDTTTNSVEVTASSLSRTPLNLISTKTIGQEQIRSNPGGNFDISKVVQSLPGVAGSVGFRNDIIVRGGAPNENVFCLDGVEVPNINHFATQGSGGGPVGIINSLFISKVNFQSSAFGAQYDNALSSVLDFDFTAGNRERFQTTALVSATDAGVTFDTPLGKNVTALFSARRSYLQFLFKAIGLPFLPDYYDFQSKIQWTITPKTTLTFIGIGAIDKVTTNKSSGQTEDQLAILDGFPTNRQNTYTIGLNLKHLTPRGYYTLVASRNLLYNNAIYNTDDDPNKPALNYNSYESENKLRLNVISQLAGWRLAYGVDVQYAQYTNQTFNVTSRLTASNQIVIDTLRVNASLNLVKYGAYASLSKSFLHDRLLGTLGIRSDINNYTTHGNDPAKTFSPRISVSYALSPRWNLNASLGRYFKLPAYTLLGYTQGGISVNQNAKYIQTIHYVTGVDYQPSGSSKIAFEVFYKDYYDYPVSLQTGLSLANTGGGFGVYGNEPTTSVGRGRAYGVEAYAQKKLSDRLYGIASYTLFKSEFSGLDPNVYYRGAYDYRHLVTLTGGYFLGAKKQWEIAAKWRFLGGAPYSEYIDNATTQELYARTGNSTPDNAHPNTLQTPVYSEVDLRINRDIYFKRVTLTVYIDIQDLLGSQNPGIPQYTLARDVSTDTFITPYRSKLLANNSSSVLPSVGVRARF